ncbi:hypothetical protein MKX01_013514 [Papaver californicum]|nr:hypothetical protein MKX01_013514 [Papaver californicum]
MSHQIWLANLTVFDTFSSHYWFIIIFPHFIWLQNLIANFKVSQGIYSRPALRSQILYLWVEADVVLEYTSEEVLMYRVTIIRVYNWDVHQRRIKQVAETVVKDPRRLSIITWQFLSYPSHSSGMIAQ